MTNVAIHTEYITLGQFLKLTDCIDSGGQVKAFLADTEIWVNGQPENRRGRKLYPNDKINVSGFGTFQIVGNG